MAARATDINNRFGSDLASYDLRKLYRKYRITRQRLVAHIAPLKYKSNEQQQAELTDVKREY